MILRKTLLVSSAIVFPATLSQAAEPILIADPIDYVRVCEGFGAGYFHIPGANTCLKLSGYVRAEAHWVNDGELPLDYQYTGKGTEADPWTAVLAGNRRAFGDERPIKGPFAYSDDFDNFTTRARGHLRLDTRTETDIGLLSGHIRLQGTLGPSVEGQYGNQLAFHSAHKALSEGYGRLTDDFQRDYEADFSLRQAYLQLANQYGTFTAGRHGSFYQFFGGGAFNVRVGGDDPTTPSNLFAVTANLGKGVSATLSAEDSLARRNDTGGISEHPVSLTPGLSYSALPKHEYLLGFKYDGQERPDLIANLRIDQAWGSAQIMGAVRQIDGRQDGLETLFKGSDIQEYESSDLGWAVGAGLEVNIPGTSVSFRGQADYTEGMTYFVTTGNGGPLTDAFTSFELTNVKPIEVTFYTELTKAWALKGEVKAEVAQNVTMALNGTYADIDQAGVYYDYDTWTAASTITWEPVKNLLFGVEAGYEKLTGNGVHVASFVSPYKTEEKTKIVGIGDDSVWGLMFRAQRTF